MKVQTDIQRLSKLWFYADLKSYFRPFLENTWNCNENQCRFWFIQTLREGQFFPQLSRKKELPQYSEQYNRANLAFFETFWLTYFFNNWDFVRKVLRLRNTKTKHWRKVCFATKKTRQMTGGLQNQNKLVEKCGNCGNWPLRSLWKPMNAWKSLFKLFLGRFLSSPWKILSLSLFAHPLSFNRHAVAEEFRLATRIPSCQICR